MAQHPPPSRDSGVRVARLAELRSRWRERRWVRLTAAWLRRSWTTVALLVVVLAIGIGALINPGLQATDLQLNEGAIYVQSQQRSKVGMLNYQIDEIAAATSVGDASSSLLQDGRTVLVNNAGSSTLQSYDAASNTLSIPVSPPAQAQMSMNAGVLSVTNPENGKVWFGPVEILSRSDFEGRANLDVGDYGKAIVTVDGQIIGLNVQDSTIVRPDGSVTQIPFQVDNSAPTAELSAIGDAAVVLDRASSQIWVEGERNAVEISSGAGAELAAPMPAESRAGGRAGQPIYATQAGLNTVARGALKSLSGQLNAQPTQPVVVGDCSYGAFVNQFVKVCDGGDPQIAEIPQLPAQATLAFQVNRGNVVLQDVNSGMIWLVDKGMKIVDDWDRLDPLDETRNEDPNPPDERTTLPDRSGPNRPPVAQDDPDLGARAGRSTRLHILDNDSDEDGDLLTITEVTPLEGASLEFIGNGAGLQITMPEDASGSYRFTYTISDGRGGTAQAEATVRALPAEQSAGNGKPTSIRPGETTVVSSGTTIEKRVLVNWRDPDGDDLVLVNALPETDDSEDEVTFTPDGTISFRDVGKTTGAKRVRVWVSDGVATVEGFVNIDARKREAAPPIANGDFVSTVVNREIVVKPMANDEGNNLILTEVEGSTDDYTVTPNYPEGSFSFRASKPGSYYLIYKISNGPVSAGLVRLDVLPISNANNPPVAVRDTALVPFGGSVVIDPLLNDTDADNDVLVIQSISQHPAVEVIMTERHLLSISMRRHTDAPVPLTYWVSDGRNSTRGTIMVFPAPQTGDYAPRAINDHVKVRAGATVNVPVLGNDVSPVGSALSVTALPDNPMGDRAWIDGEKVRISIPASTAATTMTLTYQIADAAGRTDSATITITVISADAQNEAPIPPITEARVLSNSITRIPIKLTGVDPNGDSVRLLGLGSGPDLGRIIEVGDGWMRYEAYPDSRGTDTFRYQVIDSLGAIGTGEIRVGVAPPSDDNTGPIGVPDELTVRPGRALTLPVLANDYDIDGDQFGFRDDKPIEMDFPATVAEGQFISLTAPGKPGEYIGKYFLIDKRGGTGDGTIILTVDDQAPLAAPVAVDDQLAVNDIIDQEWVEVDVLANDYDIDAPRDELTLSVPEAQVADSGVEAAVVDGQLSIKVADAMQQVRYAITDADGNMAQALVLVPGRNDSVPVLADPKAVHSVEAGKPFTVTFDTMIIGTQGRRVQLTSPETVRATKGTVQIRPEGIDFTADVSYVGPASVVFEVIDQADATDRTAKRAFITVPITVTPAASNRGRDGTDVETSNRAPDGPSNITLEVGAGEPEESFPLRGRFTDPEGDNFTFQDWTLLSGDAGIKWTSSVGGDVINASGGLRAKGDTATLSAKVVDSYGASRDFTVTITVVGSTRPLPVAAADTIEDANAGQQRSVPVLLNDRSFIVGDPGLKLLSAAVVSGSGTATVDGDAVIVTPADDFVGALNVRYTIVDATDDPDRQVDGAIQLTVRSRPSRPGTPTIEAVGDKQVTIKWTSNSSNGMPVTSRTVRAASDAGTVTFTGCQTNSCTITGLTNNVTYTFSVVETNELGDSDASPSSDIATPDVKPPPLAQPTLIFPGANQSGRLRLDWVPPVFDGSPISKYTITEVSGATAPVEINSGQTTSHTFEGLTNYVRYQFQVTATNNAGTSDPSPASNSEHPSGPPPAASNVVAYDTADPDGRQLNVTWSMPPQDADPFSVELVVGSVRVPISDPTVTSTTVNVAGRGEYSATVVITTRGGSTSSEPSPPVATTGNPKVAAPGTLTAGAPNTLSFTLGDAEGRDWDGANVQLMRNGSRVGDPISLGVGETTSFGGLTEYGVNYSVETVAYKQWAGGPPKMGATWTSAAVKVYGTPAIVDARVSGTASDNHVLVNTGSVQANGTGAQNLSYSVNGGAFTSFNAGQTLTIDASDSPTLTLRVCDAERSGNCSTVDLALSAPLTVTNVGRTLTITITDSTVGQWSCSSDPSGWSSREVPVGTSTHYIPVLTVPAGPVVITCQATGNLKHSRTITLGAA